MAHLIHELLLRTDCLEIKVCVDASVVVQVEITDCVCFLDGMIVSVVSVQEPGVEPLYESAVIEVVPQGVGEGGVGVSPGLLPSAEVGAAYVLFFPRLEDPPGEASSPEEIEDVHFLM